MGKIGITVLRGEQTVLQNVTQNNFTNTELGKDSAADVHEKALKGSAKSHQTV